MSVTSATEVDVCDAFYTTTTTTEVDNVAEREKMENRDEITGEQNVNRGIAIMQQQLTRAVTPTVTELVWFT